MHLALVLKFSIANVILLGCLSANSEHCPSALCCSKFTPTEEFMTLPGDIARTEFRLVATYQVGDTLILVALHGAGILPAATPSKWLIRQAQVSQIPALCARNLLVVS